MLCTEILTELKKKEILIDNHYKTIFESVRSACSSYTVLRGKHEAMQCNETVNFEELNRETHTWLK